MKSGFLFLMLIISLTECITVKSANSTPLIVAANTNVISNPTVIKFDAETLTNLTNIFGKNENNSNELLIAIISALLGFLLGFLATWVANRSLAKKVLIAIQLEEKYIFQTYGENLGKRVNELWPIDSKTNLRSEDQNFFDMKASLTVDWFPVFNGNTSNLCLLKEDHMCTVLETYAAMKSL